MNVIREAHQGTNDFKLRLAGFSVNLRALSRKAWWHTCAALLFALLVGTPASGDLYDGQWHDTGNGWWFIYVSSSNDGLWRYGNQFRFSYNYGSKQWLHYRNSWSPLGASGAKSDFIGDGSYHDLNNGWWYAYVPSADSGFWSNSGSLRFSYNYSPGQWWDYRNAFNKLGVAGTSNEFIGDGSYHAVWGVGDTAKYEYLNGYGYWASSGIVNDNDFRYGYGTGQWYRYYDGNTLFKDVNYFGNRQYALTDYIYWTSSGVKSSTPTGSTYGTDVQYVIWSDPTNIQVASWYIFTPGSDLKWGGGSLQVAVIDSAIQSDGTRWMRMVEQYTKEDVIVLEYEFEAGATLDQILQGLGYVKAYYGKTIDDLAVYGHGNTTGFYFGNWISQTNYSTTYATSWTKLNNLMTDGGQLMLYHCETGSAASMLDDIASRTNTKVFANVNLGWDAWAGKINSSYAYGADQVWNANYGGWFQGATSRQLGDTYYAITPNFNFIDLDFEYQSDASLGRRGYHMLFNPNSPAGWAQADMVYWWNDGNGRP